jgi:uncharacterized membrane protein YfcA
MDIMSITYPVSGVTVNALLPPAVAFIVAFFSSIGGISGAFLVLPVMVSGLGFTSPAVSATNFVYNIVAIPPGAYRYFREGRLFGPLAWSMLIGTVPGILAGYFIRVRLLSEPGRFRFFAGCVLLVIGIKLVYEIMARKAASRGMSEGAVPEVTKKGLARYEFSFDSAPHAFSPLTLGLVSFFVGVAGGAYGIGGGVFLAPFCVVVFGLPIYVVAGAALISTFAASVAGVGFYSLIPSGLSTSPDWLLGASFGLGGAAGIYLGARAQKYLPQKFIKAVLAVLLLGIALKYVLGY